MEGTPTTNSASVYVSITGLRVKNLFFEPYFWWHAFKTVRQAKRADGNISVEIGIVDGVRHTLSVWQNESAMKRFLYQGAHGKAIKAFNMVEMSKTYGYETEEPPSFDEVHALWEEHGREYAAR